MDDAEEFNDAGRVRWQGQIFHQMTLITAEPPPLLLLLLATHATRGALTAAAHR
jgi:hypothetical protein